MSIPPSLFKDTADIRAKMLEIWNLVDQNKMGASQVRLHLGIARVILDTLKVEMMAAHLSQTNIPSVPIKPRIAHAAKAQGATPN